MPHFPTSTLAGLMVVLGGSLTAQAQTAGAPARPTAVQVTVLSTMLAETRGIGEWGFAALLEVDGRRFLIDTGGRAETVLRNSEELGVDLSTVTDVVLTHNHGDHTAGLVALRRELAKKNPQAMRTTHVAPGIFAIRVDSKGTEGDGLQSLRRDYEALGGAFVEHSKPTELAPGVWFTGPVPRRHPERNWSGDLRVRTPTGLVEDTIAEDSSIVVDTASGFVVITGCGHAGIVNILEYARDFRPSSVGVCRCRRPAPVCRDRRTTRLDRREAATVRDQAPPGCPLHGNRGSIQASKPVGADPANGCRRGGRLEFLAGQRDQPAPPGAVRPLSILPPVARLILHSHRVGPHHAQPLGPAVAALIDLHEPDGDLFRLGAPHHRQPAAAD